MLLLYSLFAIQYTEIHIQFILGLLCALILCCAVFCVESGKIRLILGLLYLASAWLFPSFFFFFPAAIYILLRDRRYLPVFYGCTAYPYYCAHAGLPILAVFFGLFGFLLAYLLENYTAQYAQMESEFRQTRDDSQERNLLLSEKNKSLLEKQDYEIYTATLKERNRIAREIHDNVGHVLSRSILLLGAVKTVNKETSLNPLLDNLDGSLNLAMDSIRNSVHDLHDESINLKDVIQSLTRDFSFCPVDFQYDIESEIPREIKYCFISITKEALSNVIKHSNADRVRITMREHPALYQLCIEDNGQVSSPRGSGIGLANMQDRVYALKGNFQIITDSGFQIFITIPR